VLRARLRPEDLGPQQPLFPLFPADGDPNGGHRARADSHPDPITRATTRHDLSSQRGQLRAAGIADVRTRRNVGRGDIARSMPARFVAVVPGHRAPSAGQALAGRPLPRGGDRAGGARPDAGVAAATTSARSAARTISGGHRRVDLTGQTTLGEIAGDGARRHPRRIGKTIPGPMHMIAEAGCQPPSCCSSRALRARLVRAVGTSRSR